MGDFSDTGFTIFKILCLVLVLIPFFVLQLLSVNKTGFRLIIKSFEFWLKIIYSIMYNIALCIDYYVINPDQWPSNISLQIAESSDTNRGHQDQKK